MRVKKTHVFSFLLLLLLSFSPFGSSLAAVRPATEADRAWMEASGIPFKQGELVDPDNPDAGQAAGEAKRWLQQHATKASNISCLNPQFAEKLKTLMEAVPGGPPTIVSGYRGQAAQESARASGASQVGWCDGYHNYGMAADFNGASAQTLQWMRVNAAQFGLAPVTNANPVTGCTARGFCDPAHIQMAGPKPPYNQCGICANENGNGMLPDRSTPSSGIANALRTFFNPQRPNQPAAAQPYTQPPAPVQSPTPQTQPQICAPQFTCSGNTLYYQSSSCTTQIYQTCPSGCSGNTCAPAPMGSSSPTSILASSLLPPQQSTTPTSNAGTPPFDLINAIANPQPRTSSATVTPLVLNPATQNSIALQQYVPVQSGGQLYAVNGYAQLPQQQTFVSSDLSGNYQSPSYTQQQTSFGTQNVLETMRQTLLNLLQYLRPFGGQVPAQVISE